MIYYPLIREIKHYESNIYTYLQWYLISNRVRSISKNNKKLYLIIDDVPNAVTGHD